MKLSELLSRAKVAEEHGTEDWRLIKDLANRLNSAIRALQKISREESTLCFCFRCRAFRVLEEIEEGGE